ncbi:MAG: 2-amino-4-hydroxy-6-hydroxymethyldihydropteridine diphosphokinase [Sulfurovaceae bacterium]|nr:2-amino-4-hydroxy-6-hydroxymethyldihydropteridine diphosphokinase [Sulfurovaceae bacterium]
MRKIKILDDDHSKITTPLYPWFNHNDIKGHKVLLGIGGNVGDVVRRFERLYWYLRRSPFVAIVQTSPILRNPPFGYADQPDFYNALILIKTYLTPHELLDYILRIEKQFGRKRSFKNAPRTLDIDMIKYAKRTMVTPKLILPHPFWTTRSSVLMPLEWMKGI